MAVNILTVGPSGCAVSRDFVDVATECGITGGGGADSFVTFSEDVGAGTVTFISADGLTQVTIGPDVDTDTDTNITWVINPDGSITLTNSLTGATIDIDQSPDTDTNISYVANPDGSWTFTAPDGSNPMTIPPHMVDTDTFVELEYIAGTGWVFTPADGGPDITIPEAAASQITDFSSNGPNAAGEITLTITESNNPSGPFNETISVYDGSNHNSDQTAIAYDASTPPTEPANVPANLVAGDSVTEPFSNGTAQWVYDGAKPRLPLLNLERLTAEIRLIFRLMAQCSCR